MTSTLNADILFSTRQWEFAVDQVRLSSITNAHFFRFLKRAFEFERVEMDHVPQVDGSVQRKSWPPGIVCEFGVVPLEENQPLAVRKLGISATRVLVEAGGASDHAQIVFDSLQEMLEDVTIPTGSPVLGKPRSHSDFSVIVFTAPSPSKPALIQPDIPPRLAAAFNLDVQEISSTTAFRHGPSSQTVDASQLLWEIKPRFETHVSEGRLESRARLNSADHLALLERTFLVPS